MADVQQIMSRPYVSAGVTAAAVAVSLYQTARWAGSAAFSPTIFVVSLVAGVALQYFAQLRIPAKQKSEKFYNYTLGNGFQLACALLFGAQGNFIAGLRLGLLATSAYFCSREVYPIVKKDFKWA